MVEYIFEKSILTELVGGGCKKNVINRLDKAWRAKCEEDRVNGVVHDQNYITNKLGINHTTVPDKPPLADYQKEGKVAEIDIIDEIAYRYKIGTNLKDISKLNKYIAFHDKNTVGTQLCFNKTNREKIKEDKNDFNNEDFEINYAKNRQLNIDDFRQVADYNKYDYLYQLKFGVSDDFFHPLIKNNEILKELKIYNITFLNLIPDLIKIIPPTDDKYYVFDKEYNLKSATNYKIKLQICDIKMSEFTNKFFIELGLYMLALNSFIYNNKNSNGRVLAEDFEVIAEGIILPKKNNENEEERKERIQANDYHLEEWKCDFNTIREKMVSLFNNGILDIIKTIEWGKIKEYETLKISPKCQTCDNYGGQYSDNLKKYIKKYNNIHGTDYTIEEFYNDPHNLYCRYQVINSNDINKLPCLKNGEKNILQKKNIGTVDELSLEVHNLNSTVFNENIALKADYEIIKENVELRMRGEKNSYIRDSKTMNMPEKSELRIYVDERHDSQGRSLSFSFMYEFSGKDPQGNEVYESNLKTPYVAIIDDVEFALGREKREFIDFLIEINNILDKYEVYTNKYGQAPKFAIIYWGEKGIEHIKNLFLQIFTYIKGAKTEAEIELLYQNLNQINLKEKKKEIQELLERFNSFFTSDNELEDYRIIEKSPFYNLKAAVEDIICLDVNINNTLYEVNNLLASQNKKPIYHKPDSDDFNGWIFSSMWKVWGGSVHRRNFINTLERVLKDRLFCIYNISKKLDRNYFKGVAPSIPKLNRVYMFPKLRFGIDLFLYHKLDAAYSLIEKENIHVLQTHKKTVLGKSILLKDEVVKDKKVILDDFFKGMLYNLSEYKVYNVDKFSVDANYDEKSFALTIYPVDKMEYIYMKFSGNSGKNCICYDKATELINVNLFSYDKETKSYTTKNYRQAVQVKILQFDRTKRRLIIKLERDTCQIIEFLSNKYGFDFSHNVIVESTHVDIWEKRLKECLERIENDPVAIDILEKYTPEVINSYEAKQITECLSVYYNDKNQKLPLNDPQIKAITSILNNRLSLLWGPPGTGKSHTIAHLLLFYYDNIDVHETRRVLFMGNYDATDNLLGGIMNLLDREDVSVVRIHSKGRENISFSSHKKLRYMNFEADSSNPDFNDMKKGILKQNNKLQIFTSTPEQMLKVFKSQIRSFKFDFIIIDEASQMDLGHFVACLIKITKNTQFLFAGDNLQLPPITKVKLKEPDKNIYGSVFDYYNFEIANTYKQVKSELLFNRRSNKVIVDYSKIAFDYPKEYKADIDNEFGMISFEESLDYRNFYDRLLKPEDPIVLLNYEDGNSSQLNNFEAEQVVEIVKTIYSKRLCKFDKESVQYELLDLFEKGVGIVVPHRAQRTKIQNMLITYFSALVTFTELNKDDQALFINKIIASVDTVEKYQGQQREIMICSLVLGDEDIISQEEEFIYNPNRLNVMISRARFKAIVLASNQLISNVSDNLETISLQKALENLVSYCNCEEEILEEEWCNKQGRLRYKSF